MGVDLDSFPPPDAPATEVRRVERPSPLTGVANAWLAIVAVFVFGLRELANLEWSLGDGSLTTIMLIALGIVAAVALVGLLVGVIQWRTTTFIVDHEFRIERRFIATSTSRIDFTKVQSVDVNRPLVARILGLAEVKIDVGGEGGKRLRYLKRSRAEDLRDVLLARMEHDSPAATVGDPAGAADAPAAPAQVVYRAAPRTIALGALLSAGPFPFAIALLGWPLLLTPVSGIWLWIAILGPLVAVPAQVLANWRFTIERTSKGLRIQRGAFNRVQTTLRPGRIQTITLRQSLLTRAAGLVTVRIAVLGNAMPGEKADGVDMLMPHGSFDEARHVVGLVWPDVDPTRLRWYVQDRRGRWLTWFAQHWFAVEDDVLATRRAMLGDVVHLVPHSRVQGLGVGQGPLQRLLGLASVHVHTIDAAPDVTVGHLQARNARGLMEEEGATARAARARRRSGDDVARTVEEIAPAPGLPGPADDPSPWAPPDWAPPTR